MTTIDKPPVSISYSIDKIFECQDNNCVMIKELEQYCDHKYKTPKIILKNLMKQMDDITKSHSNGVNPNDVIMKSLIRDSLNKVVNSNYKSILDILKSLNYTTENHFTLLANEIILKSMGDAMACKNIPKNGQRTPSEIYVDIAYEFSSYMIDVDGDSIKFKNVMAKECHNYFNNFIDKNERMDQNNLMRISNFKGFMNMMGLLYNAGLFPDHIITICFEKITSLILDTSLPHGESDNYYSGFERLMNRILCHFEDNISVKSSPPIKNVEKFVNIRDEIEKFNGIILNVCPNEKNDKSDTQKQLRRFSGITHSQNITRFNVLCEFYNKHIHNG